MSNPIFKGPQGKWLTKGLIYELTFASPDSEYAIYTFQPEDKKARGRTYISLRKAFIELEDPTGYEFSQLYLGGWVHLQECLKNKEWKAAWAEWQDELEVRLRAKGIRAMIREANGDGRSAATSARWLAENGFIKKEERAAGRPSKEEKDRHLKAMLSEDEEINEDLNRITLN